MVFTQHQIDTMTIPELECCLCASIMDHPVTLPSPSVCTAMSHHPDCWESPEAIKVMEGIKLAYAKQRPMHRIVVGLLIDQNYHDWMGHKSFTQGLPLSCLDESIRPLLEHYQKKRIRNMIGDAYSRACKYQANVRHIAAQLKEELESVL